MFSRTAIAAATCALALSAAPLAAQSFDAASANAKYAEGRAHGTIYSGPEDAAQCAAFYWEFVSALGTHRIPEEYEGALIPELEFGNAAVKADDWEWDAGSAATGDGYAAMEARAKAVLDAGLAGDEAMMALFFEVLGLCHREL